MTLCALQGQCLRLLAHRQREVSTLSCDPDATEAHKRRRCQGRDEDTRRQQLPLGSDSPGTRLSAGLEAVRHIDALCGDSRADSKTAVRHAPAACSSKPATASERGDAVDAPTGESGAAASLADAARSARALSELLCVVRDARVSCVDSSNQARWRVLSPYAGAITRFLGADAWYDTDFDFGNCDGHHLTE